MQRTRSGLDKYEKNDLFHAIQATQLPVTEFELQEQGLRKHIVAEIVHLPTRSVFEIGKNVNNMHTFKCQPKIRATMSRSRAGDTWRQLPGFVQDWCDAIVFRLNWQEKYENTPDLWEMLRRDKEFNFSRESTENTPFTADEQDEIAAQLTQAKEYIKSTRQLTAEQITRIETTLDHVEEASKRIGRKDWILLFNGAVFSLILTDLITPSVAQQVLLITVQALGHLFGHGMPHLPPP